MLVHNQGTSTAVSAKRKVNKMVEKYQFVRKTILPQNGALRKIKPTNSSYQQQNTEPSIKEMPSIEEMYPTSLQLVPSSVVAAIKGNDKIVFSSPIGSFNSEE